VDLAFFFFYHFNFSSLVRGQGISTYQFGVDDLSSLDRSEALHNSRIAVFCSV
jgi:hypothetical protein